MKVAISFLCTEFHILRAHWKSHGSSKKHAGTDVGLGGVKPNKKGVEPFIGGKVLILDWPSMESIWDFDFDGAGGFAVEKNILTINNMRLNYVSQIDMQSKKIINKINNNAFNCLHSLEKTNCGFMISSTGTDMIIEIDAHGNCLFEWWAVDHGYATLPNGGKRLLNKNMSHQEYVYPTLYQTTHVNSAMPFGNKILATLFHQGELIKINKKTLETETLLSGLSCPHGVKPFNENLWTISDTKNNQVLILNQDFVKCDTIYEDFDWVQDHCHTPNGTILIADANHHRIVEISLEDKKIINEFNFSDEWRIYQIKVIKPAYQ